MVSNYPTQKTDFAKTGFSNQNSQFFTPATPIALQFLDPPMILCNFLDFLFLNFLFPQLFGRLSRGQNATKIEIFSYIFGWLILSDVSSTFLRSYCFCYWMPFLSYCNTRGFIYYIRVYRLR